jgi:STE24 endopeptidase
MVMGLFPQVRYVFLSDLLLETMTDEEIEAVFAHEIGHIVHRHMWWYAAFSVMLALFTLGPVSLVLEKIPATAIHNWMSPDVQRFRVALNTQIITALSLGMFVLLFGYLSRRFERQADVYAARTMTATQAHRGVVIRHVNPELDPAQAPAATALPAPDAPLAASPNPPPTNLPAPNHVGAYGATVVGSALQRVAVINNIPVAAREWLHGSIHSRMQYLRHLSADPGLTQTFDRRMVRLYAALLAIIVTLGAWNAVQYLLLPA